MTKKAFLLFCVLVFVGCSYGQNYLKNPKTLLKDPHFAEYKENRDDLELQYLRKEIPYAEYIQQRDRLDATYDKEVQERNKKISAPEEFGNF